MRILNYANKPVATKHAHMPSYARRNQNNKFHFESIFVNAPFPSSHIEKVAESQELLFHEKEQRTIQE